MSTTKKAPDTEINHIVPKAFINGIVVIYFSSGTTTRVLPNGTKTLSIVFTCKLVIPFSYLVLISHIKICFTCIFIYKIYLFVIYLNLLFIIFLIF